MSFVEFLRILRARWWLLAVTALACVAGGVITGHRTPPRYVGSAQVILDFLKPDPVTGAVVPGKAADVYMGTQIQLAGSVPVAARVVDQLGWANDPAVAAQFAAQAGVPIDDMRQYIAERISQPVGATIADGSNILKISYVAQSPEAARRFADMVRAAYIAETLAHTTQGADQASGWLDARASVMRARWEAALTARADFARRNNITLLPNDQADLGARALSRLIDAQVKALVARPGVAGGGDGAADSAVGKMDAAVATAQTQLGPNNPAMIALQARRDAVAASAAGTGRSDGGATLSSGQAEAATEQRETLLLNNLPQSDKINAMNRDVDLARAAYVRLALRLLEERRTAQATDTSLKPSGEATAATSPFYPNWPLIIGATLALGLALGIEIAVIVELLQRRVRSVDDLEEAAEVPVLIRLGAKPRSARERLRRWRPRWPRLRLFRRRRRRAAPA